jgi:hypothetical protein
MQERGARRAAVSDTLPDKALQHFTDRDSRVMPSQGGSSRVTTLAVAALRVIIAHRLSAGFSTLPVD